MSLYKEAVVDGNEVAFCWVPSHVGILGNELADWSAKAALNMDVSDWQVPSSDFRGCAKSHIYDEWQALWSMSCANKLQNVHPTLGQWSGTCRASRREETALAQLRIGHTWLTHSYLLRSEPQPKCDLCGEILTVKHILIDCNDLAIDRLQYYRANTMQELF